MIIEHRYNAITEQQEPFAEPAMAGAAETPVSATAELAAVQEQIAGSLSRAQAEAESLMAKAEQAAEGVREEARQQGYATGQEAGYDAGFQQGTEAAELAVAERLQAELQLAVAQAKAIVETAERDAKAMMLAAEKELVAIALAAARQVTLQSFDQDNSSLVAIVRAALLKVRDKEQIAIRVHPEDYDSLTAGRCELDAVIGDEKSLTIFTDLAVQRGGCIIDTPHGSVDAQVDTKFAMLRQALLEVVGR